MKSKPSAQKRYDAKRKKMQVGFNLENPVEAKLYKKAKAMDNFSGSVKKFIADKKTDENGE